LHCKPCTYVGADEVTPTLTIREQTYGAHEGPYQEKAQSIYSELRQNVIDNVFKACGRRIHYHSLV
jgi:Glycosyl hydrolase family 63 C-terminal domain